MLAFACEHIIAILENTHYAYICIYTLNYIYNQFFHDFSISNISHKSLYIASLRRA